MEQKLEQANIELSYSFFKKKFEKCADVIIVSRDYSNSSEKSSEPSQNNKKPSASEDENKKVTETVANVKDNNASFEQSSTKDNKQSDHSVFFVYSDVVIDVHALNELVLPSIQELYERTSFSDPYTIKNESTIRLVPIHTASKPITLDQFTAYLFEGNIMWIIPSLDVIFAITLSNVPKRTTEDPVTEPSVRGPRDGLIEDISTNIALIRRRIRSFHLACETFTIGELTSTKVAMLYMDQIANLETVNTIRQKIEDIHIDQLITSGKFEELISSSKSYWFFPTIDYSARPDFLAENLMAGRVVMLVDNNPTAMIAPGSIFLMLKSPEDSYFPLISSNVGKLLRLFALFISIFLPSFFIAISTFHPDQIPIALLSTISVARHGVPFDAPLEMIFIMLLMELFREAGIRLPSSIGSSLTVVGGIVIGDAAIRSGLVSPIIVVISAFTIIATASLVNQNISSSVILIRFISFLMGATFGVYGFIMSFLLFLVFLANIRSFGVPYLTPLSPLNIPSLLQSILVMPFKTKKKRPHFLYTQKSKRNE